MFRLFEALSEFRVRHDLDQGRPFTSWLFRIATNLCIDYLRRRKPNVQSLDGMRGADDEYRTAEIEDTAPRPDVQHEMAEQRRRLDRLVQGLPPRYKMVILLRHGRELSYNEIAEVLEVPVGTVKIRLYRARQALKRRLAPVAGTR